METVSSHEEPQQEEASAGWQDVARLNAQNCPSTSTAECPSNLRALRLAKNRRRLREQATRAFRVGDRNNAVVGTQAVLNKQKDEGDFVSRSGRGTHGLRKHNTKRHRKVKKSAEPNTEDAETNVTVKLQQFHLPEIGSGAGRYGRRDVRHRKSSNDARRHGRFGASGGIQREITLDDVQKFFLHRNATSLTDTSARRRVPRGVVRLEEIADNQKHNPAHAHESSPFTNLSSYGVKLLRPDTMDGVELRATAVCDSALVRQHPAGDASSGHNKQRKQEPKSDNAHAKDGGKAHGGYPTDSEMLHIGTRVKPSNEFNDVIRIPPLGREITSYAITPSSSSSLKKKVVV